MADPIYSGDFFIDSNFTIKQEPVDTQMCTSASVPIPHRRMLDIGDYRDLTFDFNSDVYSLSQDALISNDSSSNMWGKVDMKSETFKMDEEDIFQVDKADLIQGPTLAELNANDDTLLGDLNFDDLLLPGEGRLLMNVPSVTMTMPSVTNITDSLNLSGSQGHLSPFSACSFPPAGLSFMKENFNNTSSSVPSSPLDLYLTNSNVPSSALSPSSRSQHSSSSSLLQPAQESTPPSTSTSPLQMKHSTLHELLMKKEPYTTPLGRSVPASVSPVMSQTSHRTHHTRLTTARNGNSASSSRLSSSAPTHLGLEQIWQRREPRKHLLSTGSLAEAGSTSSLSTGGVLSPESHDLSLDEGSDSDDESDHYEYEDSSDAESLSDGEDDRSSRQSSGGSKRERFFWQYNVQAKGPKGQRLVLTTKQEDPHVLHQVTDPVFSPSCSVRGIKHSGKARKGDGNDLTPNPRKLQSIGRELDKLGRVINDMTPVSELPFNVRPKTRKEKNKLASRACRLKKKAQHEAHKIKLFGLEHEHKRLLNGIQQMKQLLAAKVTTDTQEGQEEINHHMDKVVKSATRVKIAGHTTDFVNKVLEKVRSGVPDGGLDEL